VRVLAVRRAPYGNEGQLPSRVGIDPKAAICITTFQLTRSSRTRTLSLRHLLVSPR
jgi:hypothetical protein